MLLVELLRKCGVVVEILVHDFIDTFLRVAPYLFVGLLAVSKYICSLLHQVMMPLVSYQGPLARD